MKHYKRIWFQGRLDYEHRVVWFKAYGRFPISIDHINGDETDNRLENLREVTQAQNLQNQRKPSRKNKSGFLGVTMRRGRFRAVIAVDRKQHYIGDFETAEEAHNAYIQAKRKLHAFGEL